jgi:hypothetical protein
MKDGTPTILYTEETREYATCSVSTERTEQQSNRATEHSAGHVTHRSAGLGSWSRRTSSHTDLLPEAFITLSPS